MTGYPDEWTRLVILKNGLEVFLRPELHSDTEMLWEMFSTLSKESLSNLVHPFTRERIEGWTSSIDYSKNLPILALPKNHEKKRIIGSASLSFHSQEAIRHKGLGTIMVQHLLEIAQMKGLKKVYLRVDTQNLRAIHVYEKCGFKIEARLEKEDYVNGRFRDDYRMAIFL